LLRFGTLLGCSCIRLTLPLNGHVMANGAPDGGAGYAVMPREMTSDPANRSTAEAPRCKRSRRGGHKGGKDEF